MAAAALSSWLCSSGAKSKLVRIVHPGGHIELHDVPVPAAEIMLRNPQFRLTHSQSYHQPWAIVSPDSTLMLGRKYYLLPENAVGNFQKRPTPPENEDLESNCFSGGNCMMFLASNEKGERIVRSENGNSCREKSESGEDLEGNRVKRRGVFSENGNSRGSPKRPFGSSDNWQPSLNSISEEY